MNELFPIYVKMAQIETLLVGGGPVALEKLTAIYTNSPEAKVHIVATALNKTLRAFVKGKLNIRISERPFDPCDILGKDLIILATNNEGLNSQIQMLAQQHHILLNVADKPALCDFYLGSVVQKGNLKIGISTNGKSPTIAKRLKEFLHDLLPEEIDETLQLMSQYRNQLKGDFQHKVQVLNKHTEDILGRGAI